MADDTENKTHVDNNAEETKGIKITVTVKTPKEKEAIEVVDTATVAEVSLYTINHNLSEFRTV